MTEIVAATNNAGKVREIRQILEPLGIRVPGAADVGGIPDVVEDGDTFAANAIKKAREVAAAVGRCVLADDSGLEVLALGGEPGIFSARYAGEGATDTEKVEKLLSNLIGIADRRARFVCVMAVATPDALVGTARGEVAGRIIDDPRGENGFGYDPVFVPDGYEQTFAELPALEKNRISHRARALQAVLANGLVQPGPEQ